MANNRDGLQPLRIERNANSLQESEDSSGNVREAAGVASPTAHHSCA
jgi:hypothetical protein